MSEVLLPSTPEFLRRYPRGPLYGHITGYFSYNFGSTGIERSYSSVLAGRKVDIQVACNIIEKILNTRLVC